MQVWKQEFRSRLFWAYAISFLLVTFWFLGRVCDSWLASPRNFVTLQLDVKVIPSKWREEKLLSKDQIAVPTEFCQRKRKSHRHVEKSTKHISKKVALHSVGKSPRKWAFLKMCEHSELVNISQFFCLFYQTRHLTVELSQPKPKLDWKTLKMTRQFRLEKRSKNGHIFGKISHCFTKLFQTVVLMHI